MTLKSDKTDRELLEEIYNFMNGTFEKRGLISRIELIEGWKKKVNGILIGVSGIFGTGIGGYLTWLFTGKH